MPKVSDVCNYVRSKNAGPFWITLDLSFPDRESFDRHAHSPALKPAAIAVLFGVKAALVKQFLLEDLAVVKISYPRERPQGGAVERDMHGGQQYVRLLDVELQSSS